MTALVLPGLQNSFVPARFCVNHLIASPGQSRRLVASLVALYRQAAKSTSRGRGQPSGPSGKARAQ